MVAIHSVIILCAIIFSDFRQALYGLTGYVPRGPEWSRSPGLTISFNAPTIVHIAGLWLLLSRPDWRGWKRWCLGLLILSSFVFLGRTISFVGFILIVIFLIFQLNWKKKILYGVGSVVIILLVVMTADVEFDVNDGTYGKVMSNYHHFIDPILNFGQAGGVDFYDEHLASHIYLSDDWFVVMFGESYAGHIGLAGGQGVTGSDIGVINSINANGILVTICIFLFYFSIIWSCRKNDWQPVAIVGLLSLALSFKETGLFTSHATPLFFLLYFYQMDSQKNIKSSLLQQKKKLG